MPPRPTPNPAPRTDAARNALKSFYCELCNKGYARMNEWEAHEASYDHQHTKRLKEMKAMQKDPGAGARARKAERRAEEKGGGLIRIMPVELGAASDKAAIAAGGSSSGGGGGSGATGGGFRKGGFKSAFGGGAPAVVPMDGRETQTVEKTTEVLESDSDEDDERYDPARPTDCTENCPGQHVAV